MTRYHICSLDEKWIIVKVKRSNFILLFQERLKFVEVNDLLAVDALTHLFRVCYPILPFLFMLVKDSLRVIYAALLKLFAIFVTRIALIWTWAARTNIGGGTVALDWLRKHSLRSLCLPNAI